MDAKEMSAPAAFAGLQRSRSTSTGLADLRSFSRRVTTSNPKTAGCTSSIGMSFGAILSRTCSSVAYRHAGGLPGHEGLRQVRGAGEDEQGYYGSSHAFPPPLSAAATKGGSMMRRAFSVRTGGPNGYGRIHDTRDEDDEGLQRRATAVFDKERSKKRSAGRRIVGACKQILGLKSNKL